MYSSQINSMLTDAQIRLYASSTEAESGEFDFQYTDTEEVKETTFLGIAGIAAADGVLEVVKTLGISIESAIMAIVSLGITLKRLGCLDGNGAFHAFKLTLINLKDAISSGVAFVLKTAFLPFFVIAQGWVIAQEGDRSKSMTENFDVDVLFNQQTRLKSEKYINTFQDRMYIDYAAGDSQVTENDVMPYVMPIDMMDDLDAANDPSHRIHIVNPAGSTTDSLAAQETQSSEVPSALTVAKVAAIDVISDFVKSIAMTIESTFVAIFAAFSTLDDEEYDREVNYVQHEPNRRRSDAQERRWEEISAANERFKQGMMNGNSTVSLSLPPRHNSARYSTVSANLQPLTVVSSKPAKDTTLVKYGFAYLNTAFNELGQTVAKAALLPFTFLAQTMTLLITERTDASPSRELVYMHPILAEQHYDEISANARNHENVDDEGDIENDSQVIVRTSSDDQIAHSPTTANRMLNMSFEDIHAQMNPSQMVSPVNNRTSSNGNDEGRLRSSNSRVSDKNGNASGKRETGNMRQRHSSSTYFSTQIE